MDCGLRRNDGTARGGRMDEPHPPAPSPPCREGVRDLSASGLTGLEDEQDAWREKIGAHMRDAARGVVAGCYGRAEA